MNRIAKPAFPNRLRFLDFDRFSMISNGNRQVMPGSISEREAASKGRLFK
jgi:hypothetical protein